jgi:hypothetical protein
LTSLAGLDVFVRSMCFFAFDVYPLHRLLCDILAFAQKVLSSPFLKLLFTKDQIIFGIKNYYRRIEISIESFHVSCDVVHTNWFVDPDSHKRYRRWSMRMRCK